MIKYIIVLLLIAGITTNAYIQILAWVLIFGCSIIGTIRDLNSTNKNDSELF